jgi:hypothetical protein
MGLVHLEGTLAVRLTIIPAADSVCLTIPVGVKCSIDFADEEACNQLLQLQGDFGKVTDQGILPILFKHGEILLRGLEMRKEIHQHVSVFEKCCESAQTDAQDRLQEEVAKLKEETLKDMLFEITEEMPILLDAVRPSAKKL